MISTASRFLECQRNPLHFEYMGVDFLAESSSRQVQPTPYIDLILPDWHTDFTSSPTYRFTGSADRVQLPSKQHGFPGSRDVPSSSVGGFVQVHGVVTSSGIILTKQNTIYMYRKTGFVTINVYM